MEPPAAAAAIPMAGVVHVGKDNIPVKIRITCKDCGIIDAHPILYTDEHVEIESGICFGCMNPILCYSCPAMAKFHCQGNYTCGKCHFKKCEFQFYEEAIDLLNFLVEEYQDDLCKSVMKAIINRIQNLGKEVASRFHGTEITFNKT